MNKINPAIFKAYDIRGIYPDELNEEAAYNIARAYATLLQRENPRKKLKIAVGADMRLSTPALKEKVVAGLLDSGINVTDIGLVSTPTYYFAVAYNEFDGGMQISASHNPKEWNGMKLVRKRAIPVSRDSGIQELLRMVQAGDFLAPATPRGILSVKDKVAKQEFLDQSRMVDAKQIKPFKIVVDGSNAMGTLDVNAIFTNLPCQLVKMNFELDGTFPVHEADPMKAENTKDLCARVLAEGADLGITPDGDGDRYFFCDEKGEMVPPAIVRGLMAQIELKDHPGAKVAYDIRPGRITGDMISEMGGQAVLTPVGHSLIKEMMLKEDAVFGGESSGHYFYKLPYGTFEAPMILTLKLLKYLSEQNKPFSAVLQPFKRYAHSGEINTKMASREQMEKKIEDIKMKYADGKQLFVDGVTVEYPDVWFNLRASNTEPVIRLTVEGKNQKIMQQKTEELLKFIRE